MAQRIRIILSILLLCILHTNYLNALQEKLNESVHKSSLDRNYCVEKYGHRQFLEDRSKIPPMLYTFPGVGNTWMRLFIEYATGYHTGSIYQLEKLKDILPGDRKCNKAVILVKLHTIHYYFNQIKTGNISKHCTKGGIEKFQRAVLLYRNPYDAIWSEYQRINSKSHSKGLQISTFDWLEWEDSALKHANMYKAMITLHYKQLEQTFTTQDYVYIRYENMINSTTRVEEAKKMLLFLGYPYISERVECAFVLAENPKAHRSHTSDDMSKDIAYTPSLVCDMWEIFGKVTTEKFGYTIWNNTQCTKRQNNGGEEGNDEE